VSGEAISNMVVGLLRTDEHGYRNVVSNDIMIAEAITIIQAKIVANMPQNIKKALIISILLLAAGYSLFQLYASGFSIFNKWESIGSPPEKIKDLIGIEIGSDRGGKIYKGRETKIYVLTSTGKIYSCCDGKNPTWEEAITNRSNEEVFADCLYIGVSQLYRFSDELSRRTGSWCGEFDHGRITYVLHSDGTISYKKNFSKPFPFIFSLCFFVPIGITFSLAIVYILDKGIALIRKRF